MASTFPLEIVTPDKMFFEGDIEMVSVSGTEGQLAILKDHIPLVTPLAVGKVRIKQNGEIREAAVAEGYLDVSKDKATIVTDAAEWPGEIDIERAELSRKRAEARLTEKLNTMDFERAENALKRAINRLELGKLRK